MTRDGATSAIRFPIRLLTIAFVLTAVTFAWFGWLIMDFLSLVGASVVLAILFAAWWSVVRGLQRWRTDLEQAVSERRQAEQALRRANDELEVRIAQHTAELEKTNQALQTENTGRKRTEEALRMFQFASDQAADAVFWLDQNAGFYYVNDQACRSLGYTREELMRLSLFDIDPVFSMENWEANWRRFRDGQIETLRTESQHRRKDGSVFPIEVIVKCLRFGGPELHLAFARDMTGRKQIETALTHERDLFKTLMDQFPDSIYFKDLQSRFERMSKSKVDRAFAFELARHAAAHPGGDREDRPAHLASPEQFAAYLLGKTDFDIFTEAHARPAFEDEQAIIRTGIPMMGKIEKEVWLDGRETWAITSKMPLRGQDGKIIGTFGISKDITAMKQAEEQLRQLSRAVEQSPACIVITDPAGNITYVNPKFTAVTGYTFEEAVGKNPRLLKSGEIPAEAYAELWQTITSGKEWRGEFHNKRKNGELYWESASISPILDAAGKITHFLAVKEDTTERKLMEIRLFQSQKMETVGKLAGGIAHEFNSILTVIIGQSELLREDLPAGSPLAKSAANITVAAGRAATLTRQLLAYGRKQFLRPEILDLNQVITGMDEVLRHLMGGETTGVNIVPAPGLRPVKADAGQLEQVIINLVMNAHDAMPNGGKLTLETANISFAQDSVGRYPELKPGDYVMLAISDTGVGMGADVKAHVFEPFFTTKSVGQGTGLGLSTCYGIIKQSGGHISVYSEQGRGSTFKIYLPQAEPPEKVPVQRPVPTHLPRGIETILLVEDDPALREIAAALLSRLGYTVLAAANGIEALSLSHQPGTGHIDLLFTDVVMPHMSGKELADRVRVLYPHTRILFTSAYTEHAIVHQGMLDQGVELLQKPFAPAALAHKVRAVLDQPEVPKPEPAEP
jgi:PAS domain S-box-containing protein